MSRINGAIQFQGEENLASFNDGNYFIQADSDNLRNTSKKPTFPSQLETSAPITTFLHLDNQFMDSQMYVSKTGITITKNLPIIHPHH